MALRFCYALCGTELAFGRVPQVISNGRLHIVYDLGTTSPISVPDTTTPRNQRVRRTLAHVRTGLGVAQP
eukprot:1012586-Rhodomonas_salina.3